VEKAEMEAIVDSLRSNQDVVVRFKTATYEDLMVLIDLYLMYYLHLNKLACDKLDNAFLLVLLEKEIEDRSFEVNTWHHFDDQAKMVWKEKLLPCLEAIEIKKTP